MQEQANRHILKHENLNLSVRKSIHLLYFLLLFSAGILHANENPLLFSLNIYDITKNISFPLEHVKARGVVTKVLGDARRSSSDFIMKTGIMAGGFIIPYSLKL
ncbi:MAG: hypothetical protein HGA81_03440 [Chlorobium limicola]|nr:hypothetical protein [Chlorobium limicola]